MCALVHSFTFEYITNVNTAKREQKKKNLGFFHFFFPLKLVYVISFILHNNEECIGTLHSVFRSFPWLNLQ